MRPLSHQNLWIQGTVRSSDGRPLAGISVKLQSVKSGFIGDGLTDKEGSFSFFDLAPGSYTILIAAQGFQPLRRFVRLDDHPAGDLYLVLKPMGSEGVAKDSYTVSVRQLQIPEKARREYRKALESLERGKTDEAIRHWNKSIAIYPRLLESYLQLSKVYLRRKDLSRALGMAQKAVAIEPRNANALSILGYVYLQREEYPRSKQAFLESIKASPSDWLPHFWLGWLLLQEKKPQAAYPHLVLARQLRPLEPAVYVLLFNSLLELGRQKEAIKQLDYFLAHFPDNPMAAKVRRKRDTVRKSLGARTH